jgi:hypothetical protein
MYSKLAYFLLVMSLEGLCSIKQLIWYVSGLSVFVLKSRKFSEISLPFHFTVSK